MKPKTISWILILILIAFASFVAYVNYQTGTWLTGWDNLHSEFDTALNLKRALFSAWQEYQGVGLPSGMAHAADLPRVLVVTLASYIFPAQTIRYLWTFAMLILGPLGVYKLIKDMVFGKKLKNTTVFASFIGAMFYLLNLATVQYFFTPYESFVSFFGLFPWMLYFALKYLNTTKNKDLLILFIFSVFATSAFYVQTIFITYMVILGLFVLEYVIRKKDLISAFKLLIVVLAANVFWIAPSSYFALTQPDVTKDSKINQIATDETRLMNEGYGRIDSVISLKGFWLSYMDNQKELGYEFLMREWRVHLDHPLALWMSVILFAVSVAGFIISYKEKNTWKLAWLAGLVLSLVLLGGSNPPFGPLFYLISKVIPLFDQIYRSVFTKWAIPLAFFLSVGIALFYKKISRFRITSFLFGLVLIIMMVLLVWPVFSGKLISENVRQEIPQEYLDLNEYLGEEADKGRLAFYPVQTFWGWNFYDWGYRGSGFMWYGIEQPILDRAFDVWSKYNEGFYQEVTTAFYGKNPRELANVFDKYDVSFFLVDASVYVPEGGKENLRYEEIDNLLIGLGAKDVWHKGGLTLYKINDVNGLDNFVYSPDEYIGASAATDYVRYDPLYQMWGEYLNKDTYTFPFTDLYKERQNNISYQDDDIGTKVTLTRRVASGDHELTIPPYNAGEKVSVPVTLALDGETFSIDYYPFAIVNNTHPVSELPEANVNIGTVYDDLIISFGGEVFDLRQNEPVTKTVILTVGEPIEITMFDPTKKESIDIGEEFVSQEVNRCWEREEGKGVMEVEKSGDEVKIITKDVAGCMSFKLEKPTPLEYMLSISQPYRSEDSSRPYFCVLEEGEQVRCENSEVFYVTKPSEKWAAVDRHVVLESDVDYWYALAGKPPDEEGKEWSITYRAPVLMLYPIVEKITYISDAWEKIFKDQTFAVKGGDITISSYSQSVPVDFNDDKKVSNCDVFERGKITKSVFPNYYLYETSGRGTLCDYNFVEGVSIYNNYLLRFTGENISGNNLKFFLHNNSSKRSDIIDTLQDSGSFDNSYTVLDWMQLEDLGYTLNFQNRSFGGEVSENKLEEVAFYDYPFGWYSQWYLGGDGSAIQTKTNSLSVINVNKTETYKYEVEAKGNGVLVLSQGYDDGWIAYVKGEGSIFGNKLEHFKAKGWANGWEVESDTCVNSCTLVLIYVPQHLQTFGFVLLGTVLIILSVGVFTEVKKKH